MLGEFHHMIHGMADVMDSKCNSLFIVTEKLENQKQFPEER